jgi:apolipoprotein N-acyltransferase
MARPLPILGAFLLGAATVFGFAPYYLWALPILTLALLFALWRGASWRRAATLGFAFGLGFFLAGVHWVYVSLHDFGGMDAVVAALATLIFCAYLALFPALVGALYALGQGRVGEGEELLLLVPMLWTLGEWVRGTLFSGFPWLALGYSQVPGSPLAGYAPLGGGYAVTLAVVICAGALAYALPRFADGRSAAASGALTVLLVVGAMGVLAGGVQWTTPTGAPVSVSLLQGDVSQDMKWREEELQATMDLYLTLTERSKGRIVIMPETALPVFADEVPDDYWAELYRRVAPRGGNVLVGVVERDPVRGEYYNTVATDGIDQAQVYRKFHIVPFGEYIPLRPVFGWLLDVLQIPLLDFGRGAERPEPVRVSNQALAIGICYEDAFGEETIRQLPAATLLVNVSNDAWFGRTAASEQHLQIAQMRALESGRMMLRANNTGVTGIIDERGRVVSRLPSFTRGVLEGTAQGRAGATPFVRWSNRPLLILCVVTLAVAILLSRRKNP